MKLEKPSSATNDAAARIWSPATKRARPSPSRASFVYSGEQQEIIHCSSTLLAVLAFAGCGKTAVLRGYAEERAHLRILYLAYNRATALEATGKFGHNVKCKTTHSLAFASHGKRFQEAKKLRSMREFDVMGIFGIIPVQAHLVLETVNAFIHSDSQNFDCHHVPRGISASDKTRILDYAVRLWQLMCDTSRSDIPMPHDGYLKLFALSKPNLSRHYDLILFDEAQDANPVTTGLLMTQTCPIVIVGDPHQAIYNFRGSQNALASVSGATVMSLTGSYRFGPELALISTFFLRAFKGEQNVLRGLGPDVDVFPGKFDPVYPITTICRTNAKVFECAARGLGAERMHFVGGVDAYPLDKLLDLQRLASGERPQDSFYRSFASAAELYAYAKTVKDKETAGLLDLVDAYGDRLPDLVAQLRNKAEPDIKRATAVVSTTHRAKGLEFRQVRVPDDDFAILLDGQGRLRVGADRKLSHL